MDFLHHFDDELFSSKETKSDLKEERLDYYPKDCTPLWFNSNDIDESDTENYVSVLKFRADFLYANKNYDDALQLFKKILPFVSETNEKCKKDCEEGIIRCQMKLRCHHQALDGILKMITSTKSSAQTFNAFMLLTQVYHELNDIDGELHALQELINSDSLNASLWFRLAMVYLSQCQYAHSCSQTTCSKHSECKHKDCLSVEKSNKSCLANSDAQSNVDDFNFITFPDKTKSYWFMAASFLRARILLQTLENHPHYLNYENSKAIATKIDQILGSLEIPKSFADQVAQAFYHDDSIEEEIQTTDNFESINMVVNGEKSFLSTAKETFEEKWFFWIQQT